MRVGVRVRARVRARARVRVRKRVTHSWDTIWCGFQLTVGHGSVHLAFFLLPRVAGEVERAPHARRPRKCIVTLVGVERSREQSPLHASRRWRCALLRMC